MQNLIWPDIVIISIIIFSIAIGIWRGFIKEALSVFIWCIAVYLSFTFYKNLFGFFKPYISNSTLNNLISFFSIFLVSLIVGMIINWFISRLLSVTGISLINRLMGMCFGAARGVLVVLVIYVLISFTPLIQQDWWQNSVFIIKVQHLAMWLKNVLPKDVSSVIPKV